MPDKQLDIDLLRDTSARDDSLPSTGGVIVERLWKKLRGVTWQWLP